MGIQNKITENVSFQSSVGADGAPQSSMFYRHKDTVAARTVGAAEHETGSLVLPLPACARRPHNVPGNASRAWPLTGSGSAIICRMHIPRPLPSLVPFCAPPRLSFTLLAPSRQSVLLPFPVLPDRRRDSRCQRLTDGRNARELCCNSGDLKERSRLAIKLTKDCPGLPSLVDQQVSAAAF